MFWKLSRAKLIMAEKNTNEARRVGGMVGWEMKPVKAAFHNSIVVTGSYTVGSGFTVLQAPAQPGSMVSVSSLYQPPHLGQGQVQRRAWV